MARNATSAGDSEILTFILALQCFVAFILARAWIEGTIPGIGLVGGVVCYTGCLGWGCGKASNFMDDRRNKKAMKAVRKERKSKLANPYTDRPVVAYWSKPEPVQRGFQIPKSTAHACRCKRSGKENVSSAMEFADCNGSYNGSRRRRPDNGLQRLIFK